MANILDGICPEGSILDGLAEWPASTTRKEWFRLTRELVQKTIADMDLDPAAMAEVNVPAFILDVLITIQEGVAGLEICVVGVRVSTTPVLSLGSSWIDTQANCQEQPKELLKHYHSVVLRFIAVKNADHHKQETAQRQNNRVDQGQYSGFLLIGE